MKHIYDEQFHTPGPDDMQTGLWIIAVGHYLTVGTTDYVLDRVSDEHLLGYCVKQGHATFHIELAGDSHPVREGDFFSTPPTLVHSIMSNNPGWEIWWVHFAGHQASTLMRWLSFTTASPVLHGNGHQQDYIDSYKRIYSLLEQKDPHYELDAALEINRLLFGIKKSVRGKGLSETDLARAMSGEAQDIDEMAASAGMSKFHFVRKFKSQFGMTPWRYVICRRMTKAKELLSDDSLSIKSVAAEIGFKNSNYFSTVFRKETGLSPGEFRKTLLH